MHVEEMPVIITSWTVGIGFIITSFTSSMTVFTLFVWGFRVISTEWTWSVTFIVIEVMFFFTWSVTLVGVWSETGQTGTVT